MYFEITLLFLVRFMTNVMCIPFVCTRKFMNNNVCISLSFILKNCLCVDTLTPLFKDIFYDFENIDKYTVKQNSRGNLTKMFQFKTKQGSN